MDASEPEVDSSLPQLSNLNSDFSTVEVSVFYNSRSGLVRPVHNIIRVEMQRDLVGTPRRCTVGIFDRFAVVQLYRHQMLTLNVIYRTALSTELVSAY